MNKLQKQILDIIQARFPVEHRPFARLADQLKTSESVVIKQITQLKQTGVIRRIGAIFNAAHLGYVSTLVAAKLSDDKLSDFVGDVNAMPGVSHNYSRAHNYNVWFTLTMPNEKSIDQTIEQLRNKYETQAIYSLPAKKLFKINVNFDFSDQSQNQHAIDYNDRAEQIGRPDFNDWQIALICQLQEDLPVIPEPFNTVAESVEKDIDVILEQIKIWKSLGLIRRFGSSIRHQLAGFTANGMAVFEIEPERIDNAGNLLAQYPQVSHCYHRPTAPDWPYNLFAMTHCQSAGQLDDLIKQMVRQIEPIQYDVLLSAKEYKKTNVKYFL